MTGVLLLLLAAAPGGDVVVMLRDGARADDVLVSLPAGHFTVHRRYEVLPAFAGRGTGEALLRLARDPRVKSVTRDLGGHASLAESGPLIGAPQARAQTGLTGKGVRIAVLDTGVESAHPDLADGGVYRTKCFVLGGCQPGNTDVGDLAPEGSGHGTHVSGTLTGDGKVAPAGVAPGAELLVIRVFDDVSYGRESDWAAALDWILANNATLGVRLVNLSLGTDDSFDGGAACAAAQPLLALAVEKLRDAGVVSFAASGNEAQANAMNSPACVPAALAVGAVYDADLGREPDVGTYSSGCVDLDAGVNRPICFSNSSPDLDLLAPGSRIRAPVPGGGIGEKRGTSQATPHATGVAALMLELDPALTPDALEQLLKTTGLPVTDPKNGRTTPRIDARAALLAVQSGFCGRHVEGDACPRACDGGTCPVGRCTGGACVAVAVDAGMPDAGAADAGGGDAGVKDAGVSDAGSLDAGADVTLPGVDGTWPAARTGCSAGVGGLGLAAFALLLLSATRRGRAANRS